MSAMQATIFWFFVVLLPNESAAHVLTYRSLATCERHRQGFIAELPESYLVTRCSEHPRLSKPSEDMGKENP